MSEIGDVIAAIPDSYTGETTCSFATSTLEVDGRLVDVIEADSNDDRHELVVDSDGTNYHLTATRQLGPDGLTEWVTEPVRTGSSVELGDLHAIDIEPPDDDIERVRDDDIDADPDDDGFSAAISDEGTAHAGGKATDSLADRRSARNHRVENYAGDDPADEVRDELRADGVASTVVREFKRLVSEEIRITDRVGQRPDIRNVIRFQAGDDTVFDDLWRRRETADPGDRVVGIALDMSGSMRDAEREAKAAVGALGLAASAVDDEIVMTAFPQGKRKSALVTGPYESWQWRHLNSTRPGGGTPMLPAVRDTMRLMRPLKGRERVLFVVTDGRPKEADEVADLVEDLRAYGTAVVGFGFGRVKESTMADVFGEDGYRHVEIEELPRALISCYLDQLELDAELASI